MAPFRSAALAVQLAVLLMVSAGAWAAPVRTDNVEAELTAERSVVAPGQTVRVALTQRIRPGWHTYWVNPGDSGLPTEIQWTLPEDWRAGPIQWPAPRRIPVGPLVNFGYENEVHLLTEIAVPATARPGETVTLTAAASWLVCEEICIPEQADLTLDLAIAATAAAPSAEQATLFAEADSAMPVPSPVPVRAERRGDRLVLTLPLPEAEGAAVTEAYFFPEETGAVDLAAPQTLKLDRAGLHLAVSATPSAGDQAVAGVLALTEVINGVPRRQMLQVAAAPAVQAGGDAPIGVGRALLLAMLGGIVLNLMPCVFPVLSMKALALVSHRGAAARGHGLAYAAGVLASFAVIGGALLALRATGARIGWGFQLQDPFVVAVLAYVLFALGLSLSGVFQVTGRFVGAGQSLAAKEGFAGSFFTGALATVVATPCTAPFMGAALGFALVQPPLPALGIFLALGFGLALPFLVLTFTPALLHHLPRPGLWMERVKQVLAFPLYGSAAWLVWVLSIQTGPDGVAAALAGLTLVGFAAWLFGVTQQRGGTAGRLGAAAAVVAIVAAGALARLPGASAAGAAAPGAEAPGGPERFSPARLSELRAAGKPVLVNLTAAWCITCLVNERVALSTPAVQSALRSAGFVYLKGDWTNRDPEITAVLERFGRSGVPLYLVYHPGQEPVILPQILTEGIVLEALRGTGA
jgi:thiol:disulfide interchange protein DsbD